jgi:hypothetical protein
MFRSGHVSSYFMAPMGPDVLMVWPDAGQGDQQAGHSAMMMVCVSWLD